MLAPGAMVVRHVPSVPRMDLSQLLAIISLIVELVELGAEALVVEVVDSFVDLVERALRDPSLASSVHRPAHR